MIGIISNIKQDIVKPHLSLGLVLTTNSKHFIICNGENSLKGSSTKQIMQTRLNDKSAFVVICTNRISFEEKGTGGLSSFFLVVMKISSVGKLEEALFALGGAIDNRLECIKLIQ